MESMIDYLSHQHRHCDERLAAAERAAANEDWALARRHFDQFEDATLHHFAAEEKVLFPAFEEATGNSSGPTAVMRAEHQRILDILAALDTALQGQKPDAFLGYADTLNLMLQQHNMKEEGILYPMIARLLQDDSDTLMETIRQSDAILAL